MLPPFPGTLLKLNQKTGEILSAKAIRATSAPVIYDDDQVFISRRSDRKGEAVSESVSYMAMKEPNKTKDFRKKDAPYLDKTVQEEAKYKEQAMDMDAGNGFAGGAPSTSGWNKANENVGYSNVSSLQQFQGSRTLNYDGALYTTMGDEIVSTDAETGEEHWRMKLDGDLEEEGGFLGTPPIEVGGYIVVADFRGILR